MFAQKSKAVGTNMNPPFLDSGQKFRWHLNHVLSQNFFPIFFFLVTKGNHSKTSFLTSVPSLKYLTAQTENDNCSPSPSC